MLIQREGTKSILEIELPMHIKLVYSTRMFRKDIGRVSASLISVFVNFRVSNSGRHER